MKLETIREAYMRADSIWRDARRAKNDQLIREARDLHDTTAAAVNACGPVFAEVARVYCESMKRGTVVPDIDHWLYNAAPADWFVVCVGLKTRLAVTSLTQRRRPAN